MRSDILLPGGRYDDVSNVCDVFNFICYANVMTNVYAVHTVKSDN